MNNNHRFFSWISITIVISGTALFQACCTGSVYRAWLIPVREVNERKEAALPLSSDAAEALVNFVAPDVQSNLREVLLLFYESSASNLKIANFDNSIEIEKLLGSKPASTDIVNSCDEDEPAENTRRAYDFGKYVLIFFIDSTEYPNNGGLIPDTARVFARLIIQKSFSRTGQK